MNIRSLVLFIIVSAALFLYGCSTSGPGGLFRKASPHEKYGLNLTNAGLHKTALGRAWFEASESSLNSALSIAIPYQETGYFPAEKARATAFRFDAKHGEKLTISLQRRPLQGFMLYADLWTIKSNGDRKLLAYADTGQVAFSYEIDESGTYLLRLQPELLRSGEYTLTISSGPTLAFPVRNGRTMSFWGAERDAGVRRHEGIDIFAPLRTPALAVAPGTVTRVGLNNLGGKVVFMRPEGKNYNLYYAHLDEQLTSEGARVNTGDTLGLIGNTGNAKGGPPHLHFGIYTSGGAIDPFPFVDQTVKTPQPVRAALAAVGTSMRTDSKQTILYEGPGNSYASSVNLPSGTLAEVTAATSVWYKVTLPNGSNGFISHLSLKPASAPLRQIRLASAQRLLDAPDTLAVRKKNLTPGTSVKVLGNFADFYFVDAGEESGWIIK